MAAVYSWIGRHMTYCFTIYILNPISLAFVKKRTA